MYLLKKDLEEAASIERKRQIHEERKSRIFNHRNRVIGIDCEALEKQITEKNARRQEELTVAGAQAEQVVRDAQRAMLLEKKMEEEKRKKNAEINIFRLNHQKKETRREFDLYDRNAWMTDLPSRLGDDDPRCGVASAQKFSGEDLSSKSRLLNQHEQQRSWLEQQIMEHREADAYRKAADVVYDEKVLDQDRRACQLDLQEQEVRRQMLEAAQYYNKSLADDNEHRRMMSKKRIGEDDRAEIHNMVTGDLLTENSSMHLSAFGPGRVIGYAYKGMTEQERNDIRNFQLLQIQEKKTQKASDERRDTEFEQAAIGLALHGTQQERALQRRQRELDEKILGQNKRMSAQQKAHQRYLNEVVFTNEPTPSYFDQFNKTAR